MSREAIKHVAFLGKAPTSRHEIHWILQFADRLADRSERDAEPLPDNVIPFPGSRSDGRQAAGR